MLGSVGEAEDVVQEAFLPLHRELEGGARIESPEAYLVTVVARLGIDELRSARARREVYVGERLQEPIFTAEDDDLARHAEIADSLSVGLLVLLETLSPEQRAVFLLREVFEYPYERMLKFSARRPRQSVSSPYVLVVTWPRANPASRHRENRANGSPIASLRRSRKETSRNSGDCSADDVTLRGDGEGRLQPWHDRYEGACTLHAPCSPGHGWPNASPAPCISRGKRRVRCDDARPRRQFMPAALVSRR
jgi:hypothetical protein